MYFYIWKKHFEVLKEFFYSVKSVQLTLNQEKCQCYKSELKCIGYVVSALELLVDPEKVEASPKKFYWSSKNCWSGFLVHALCVQHFYCHRSSYSFNPEQLENSLERKLWKICSSVNEK